MKERDLTLDRAIEIGIVNELSDRDNTELSNLPAIHKDEIHSVVRGKKAFSSKEASKPKVRNCKNCGGDHPAKLKLCPAFGRKCLYCGKLNHFEKVCRSKKASTRQGPRGQRSNRRNMAYVNEISPELSNDQGKDDLFVIDAVTELRRKREIFCTMTMANQWS